MASAASSTPVSRNPSHRRRPKDPPSDFAQPFPPLSSNGQISSSSPSPGGCLSTSTPNNQRHRFSGDRQKSLDKVQQFRLDDEDDDDVPFLSSQFQPKNNGEVYWNYEASPRAKEQLRKWMQEADANSPSSKEPVSRKKPKTACAKDTAPTALRIVPRNRRGAAVPVDPKVEKDMIASLLEFSNNVMDDKKEQAQKLSPEARKAEVEKNASAGFSALKEAASSGRRLSEEDPFCDEEDDSFDLLLSQMVEDDTPRPTKVKSRPAAAVTSASKPVTKPAATITSASATEMNFKRFKSASDPSSQDHSPQSSTFNRTHSSPTIPASNCKGPLLPGGRAMRTASLQPIPRCSRDEIERKRQEAVRRRKLATQGPL